MNANLVPPVQTPGRALELLSAESVGVNRLATPQARPTGKAGASLLYFPDMRAHSYQ